MGISRHKNYIFAICLLVLDRINFADSNHLLIPGRTTGRIVGVQDRVLESCRGHFMCEAFPIRGSIGLTCINGNLLCDGIRHCRDGSDELPISCPGRGRGASIGGVGIGQGDIVIITNDNNNQGTTDKIEPAPTVVPDKAPDNVLTSYVPQLDNTPGIADKPADNIVDNHVEPIVPGVNKAPERGMNAFVDTHNHPATKLGLRTRFAADPMKPADIDMDPRLQTSSFYDLARKNLGFNDNSIYVTANPDEDILVARGPSAADYYSKGRGNDIGRSYMEKYVDPATGQRVRTIHYDSYGTKPVDGRGTSVPLLAEFYSNKNGNIGLDVNRMANGNDGAFRDKYVDPVTGQRVRNIHYDSQGKAVGVGTGVSGKRSGYFDIPAERPSFAGYGSTYKDTPVTPPPGKIFDGFIRPNLAHEEQFLERQFLLTNDLQRPSEQQRKKDVLTGPGSRSNRGQTMRVIDQKIGRARQEHLLREKFLGLDAHPGKNGPIIERYGMQGPFDGGVPSVPGEVRGLKDMKSVEAQTAIHSVEALH